jgi:hypothetical protein
MSPEAVFKIANSLALLGWIVLVIFGWQRRVSGLVTAVVLPLAFAALYTLVVALHAGESSGDFTSLSGVAALFSHRWFLLAGWVHYLAFDLFIGSWEVRDAAAQRIPHWAVIPCLILTFFVGAGWLAAVLYPPRSDATAVSDHLRQSRGAEGPSS